MPCGRFKKNEGDVVKDGLRWVTNPWQMTSRIAIVVQNHTFAIISSFSWSKSSVQRDDNF
jgi:hypothetical protein